MNRRGKEQFLADCEDEERTSFANFFHDCEELARSLGDPNPSISEDAPANDFALRWAFEGRKGASLRLRHPKLTGAAATILWAFPSRNHDRLASANGLSIHPGPLTEHGIHDEDVAAYGHNLAKAEFEDVGERTWRTVTAGSPDGFSRIYHFPANRHALLNAIRSLVEAVGRY